MDSSKGGPDSPDSSITGRSDRSKYHTMSSRAQCTGTGHQCIAGYDDQSYVRNQSWPLVGNYMMGVDGG